MTHPTITARSNSGHCTSLGAVAEGAANPEEPVTARGLGSSAEAGAASRARWLDEAQQRAWRSVQVMQARLNAVLGSQLAAESDLSYADYVVLVVLTDTPHAAARVHELARYLGWERSRVSHHVARMVERGLVRKERSTADRRGSFVVVTEAGRRAIEAAAPGHVAAVRKFFIDALTDEQLDALADAAERVVDAIDRAEHAAFDGER
jgi:DNA-binding MarR family transcriptional regulator